MTLTSLVSFRPSSTWLYHQSAGIERFLSFFSKFLPISSVTSSAIPSPPRSVSGSFMADCHDPDGWFPFFFLVFFLAFYSIMHKAASIGAAGICQRSDYPL
ncbi:hypothetical protein BDQ94DRAFT_125065 [Aspergillus welwitschiae]|uniref:Uncharacterized protein n=1 Tax=Aspergillus welwitschiae TaxID=1341132 RepID=A0A3F3Q9B6_9EURO|nr:hypothetical protein BDQ94DRAFT_125065 [Aspergillus welwitschiae]RDH35743.1 hypothetical protein BDQ94DRAFT_125065 [Aspergillus welwitschiae]